jgi:hypothetical protein
MKKSLIILGGILVLSASLFAYSYYKPEATCTGSKNCHACKNCKYCKHCAKEGGTCGVCK